MYISIDAVKAHLEEHLPQTSGHPPRRGGPPGAAARADLIPPQPAVRHAALVAVVITATCKITNVLLPG